MVFPPTNKLIGLLTASAILIAVIGACSTTSQTPATNDSSRTLSLTDCQIGVGESGMARNARCGKLTVHEDPHDSTSQTIELNVVVVPAVSRNSQPDPVFLLAGGPGEAATKSFGMILPVFDRINQTRDLVLVDQRGTGESNPLTCKTVEGTQAMPGEAVPSEVQLEEIKACLADLDGDTRLYTTSTFVQDLEQVRQALGYTEINLLGISYGTRVGLAYLREYPEFTRSVLLDGVTPMDWSLGPANPGNAQRAIDLLFERCAADESCRAAFPNLRGEFASLMASLKDNPVKLSLPNPLTAEMTDMVLNEETAGSAIFLLSYAPETAALLPLLIHTAQVDKNLQPLAAQYLIAQGGLSSGLANGLYYSVICAEDVPFYPDQVSTGDSYLPLPVEDMVKACEAWPHAQIDPAFKQPVESGKPVLLLSGEADPVTPPQNADAAAQTLLNSLSIVVPGMGHGNIYRGCLPKLTAEFFDRGIVENLDTSCVQQMEPMPFFLNFSGPHP